MSAPSRLSGAERTSNRAAAEVLDVEPGVGKDLQVGEHRRILVLVERHRHRRSSGVLRARFLPVAELFVEQAFVRGVLVNKHQRFAVIPQDDVGVERLADHPVYRRRRIGSVAAAGAISGMGSSAFGTTTGCGSSSGSTAMSGGTGPKSARVQPAARLRLMVENAVDRPCGFGSAGSYLPGALSEKPSGSAAGAGRLSGSERGGPVRLHGRSRAG